MTIVPRLTCRELLCTATTLQVQYTKITDLQDMLTTPEGASFTAVEDYNRTQYPKLISLQSRYTFWQNT